MSVSSTPEERARNERIHAEIFGQRVLSQEEMRALFDAWCGKRWPKSGLYFIPRSDSVYANVWDGEVTLAQTIPDYSNDIREAWRVVERMRADGWRVSVYDTPAGEPGGPWFAAFDSEDHDGFSYGDSPAVAICNASLSALSSVSAVKTTEERSQTSLTQNQE